MWNDSLFDIVETDYDGEEYHSDQIIKDYEEGNGYEYPLLHLSGHSLQKYKVETLAGMVVLEKEHLKDVHLIYNVYVEIEEDTLWLGYIDAYGLRSLLDSAVFKEVIKKVYLAEGLKYEGELLYALCGARVQS